MITATLGTSPGVAIALDFALRHIGLCEEPLGSNRNAIIDEWAREFGSPRGSHWCALAVGKARKTGGLWIPSRDVGSCDQWVYEAEKAGVRTTKPEPGAAVVYTTWKRITGGRYDGQIDAVHMGIILRVSPMLLAIEGNTGFGGMERNGWLQTLKQVDPARVLCYIAPVRAAGSIIQ